MFETVMGPEFDLPATKLQDMREQVRLPRFIPYECPQSLGMKGPSEYDDSLYHYYFLSQVAHRIMLSRIHTTLFYSSKFATSRQS